MDRADKIFTILAGLGLVAVLLHQHRPRGALGNARLGVSTVPGMGSDTGPAYLLSNLPMHRTHDDRQPAVSFRVPEIM